MLESAASPGRLVAGTASALLFDVGASPLARCLLAASLAAAVVGGGSAVDGAGCELSTSLSLRLVFFVPVGAALLVGGFCFGSSFFGVLVFSIVGFSKPLFFSHGAISSSTPRSSTKTFRFFILGGEVRFTGTATSTSSSEEGTSKASCFRAFGFCTAGCVSLSRGFACRSFSFRSNGSGASGLSVRIGTSCVGIAVGVPDGLVDEDGGGGGGDAGPSSSMKSPMLLAL